MKASELRIGNWVNTIDGYKQVTEIVHSENYPEGTESFITDCVRVSGLYLGPIGGVLPIPLTEEWLLKLGLIEGGYKQMYGNEYYKYGLSIYLEGGEYRFYTSTNRAYTSYEYVHEIQNLFSALGC